MVEIFKARPGLSVGLLRNHGLVAIGKSLDHAFELAYDAEMGMRYYYQALQIGKPIAMSPEQMDEIRRVYM